MFGNFKIKFLFFTLMFLASFQFVLARSASVENNASAVSETGGNVIEGGGNIETGSASSSVKVETKVGGSEEKIYIKTEAKAKANDEEVEIETEGNEPVSLKEENGGAKAQINTDINTDENTDNNAEEDDSNMPMDLESDNADKIDENSEDGLVARTINRIKEFFRNIFNKE